MDPPQRISARPLVLTGALARADIPGLCQRAHAWLEGCDGCSPLLCDVGGLVACDAVAVDALAHLQLIARRHGSELRVLQASGDLRDLISLAGLSDVLRVSGP